ncbi:hypothetical protein KB236_07870 [Levilactobacillus brevis]|nr:hypothetical protein KB236_07870 [Levilactobacillus brevis]
MTNFGKLFKVFNRNKFATVNQLMLIELAVIAVSLIWSLIWGNLSQMSVLGTVSGWSGLAYVVGFILISRRAENAFTHDTYRLIPAKDTTFYLANLFSSLVMFLYLIALQVILHLVGIGVAWSRINPELDGIMRLENISSAELAKGITLVILVVLALFILALTTITLIHLTVSATNSFLPVAGKRVVDAILYIVVIVLVVRLVAFFFGQVNQLMTTLNLQGTTNMILPILGMLVLAALESVLNIFLMKRWVETVAN